MPPRKSDVSKAATGDEGTPAKEPPVKEGIAVEDLALPKSIVTRLAKGVLPPNTQIQANAMLAVTKSATVFVNYLATHANENAQGQGRKTIAPQDVLKALDELEFPDFKPRLEAELAKFNEVQTEKRNAYRKKVAADKASGKPAEGDDDDATVDNDADTSMDGQPAAKKARRDPDDTVEEHGDLHEGDTMGDRDEDDVEDEEVNGDETEDEEDNNEPQERLEMEDPEETEEQEDADEALDNGDDSD